MEFKLEDIIDIELLQNLQNKLNMVYSFPSAIIDNEGKILTAVAWQDICTKFHRLNPECEKECIKSDQYILAHILEANPAVSYKCPHGMIDNATPIIINGVHMGNFFTGQFFLEKPDLDFFRTQAKVYGFDETEYIKAVEKVPIWTKDKLKLYLDFIKGFIEIIASIGYNNLKEIETNKLLKENFERNQSILQTALDGFWLVDMQGQILEVNDAYCRMSGYSKAELLQMNISNFEATETLDDISSHIQKITSNGQDRFQSKHRHKDGSIYDVEISVQFQQNIGEKFVCFLRDITKKKLAEEELIRAKEKAEESERSLKESQTIARLGGWELDIDTGVFTFTDNLLRIFHTSAEKLGGYQMTINEYAMRFVHPDDAAMVEKETKKALETDNPDFSNYVEHRIKYFDGGIGYIGVKYYIKKNKSGRTIKTYGVNQDITERKLIEQELIAEKEKAEKGERALKHSHDLMKYLIEHNRSAVAVHDKNFKYIYVSQRYLDDYQVKEKDIIGKHHYDVFPDLPQKWRDVHKKALAGEVSSAEDDPYYKDDGTVAWTRWECRPWFENDNSIGGFIVYTEVITERKNMELELKAAKEKAEESDQLKTAFLQNMSHEIRTPLNAISGFSGLLNKANLTSDKRKRFVSIIQNSSKQLVSIVTDILTISSLETQQEKLNIDKVCMNNVIVDLLAIFRQQAQNQNISIYAKQHLSDQQSEIYTDGTKITQILTNLLTNAFKFTHEGYIEFGYTLKESKLEFFVKDTGIGIKQEFQKKIFERFIQADKSINKLYGGTGLGLAISKAFVELLGGKIWVESIIEKGSIFYFTIPYNPVQGFSKTEIKTKHIENFKTVLVAEDEEYNFLLIEELLIDLELTLLHAKDGKETIEIIKTNPKIDLILMDIKMPIMSGHEAAKIIKELKPHLPIVAQSAYALEHERAKYEGVFDDYLTKPINEDDLKQMVFKYIDVKKK